MHSIRNQKSSGIQHTAATVKATAAQLLYVCNVNAARDMTHTARAN